MDATFLARIKSDFPEFKFIDGARFSFRPPRTIVVGPEENSDSLLLLHELGHALCGHRDFDTSVRRVKMEREAWQESLCRRLRLHRQKCADRRLHQNPRKRIYR